MTKGIVHARREKFIRLMVPVTTAAGMIEVYKACYPNCKKDTTARVNCYRLLQDTGIVAAIDKLKQEQEGMLRDAKRKEIERMAKEQVASETQLDAVLSAIALGSRTRKKKVVVFNPAAKVHQTVTVEEEPDETDIIGAANLLYKRKGSFAEKKIKHEMGDSFIEVMKRVTAAKNKPDVS